MASPQIYKTKLAQLNIKRWNFQSTNLEDAQQAIAKIKKIEMFLQALNSQVASEVKRIERNYKKAKKQSGITILNTFLSDVKMMSEKRQIKERLDAKRTQLLIGYAEVKSISDELLQLYNLQKQNLFTYVQSETGQKSAKTTSAIGKLLEETLSNHQDSNEVNYKTYIRSSAWKKKAEAEKARAGYRCQGCNKSRTEVQLEAHHRTYERLGNELPGDITVLCRDCHQAIEEAKAKSALAAKQKAPNVGTCIRCSDSIDFNLHKPLCLKCYKNWSQERSYSSEEKYCHVCGQTHPTSMSKPACLNCYKEIKFLR